MKCPECGDERWGAFMEARSGLGSIESDNGVFTVSETFLSPPDFVEVSIECMSCGWSRMLSTNEWEFG